jgi:signal transduction histidine kinase
VAEFFNTNRVIVYFIYGEAFFVLGLAIALQSRKHSQLALAKRLWLLAVFGIVHGIYEWGSVFIPIQQTYLPAGVIGILRVLQLVLEAVSFLALFQFGVELLALASRRLWWSTALPSLLFLIWGIGLLVAETRLQATLDEVFVVGDILSRYGLAVPAALAAAWALWRQAQYVRGMDLPRITNYFRGAAYAFVAYAAASAIVPEADFFPASVANYDAVIALIGIPVPVFRAAIGTAIAYLIIRGSEIFDVETDRLLEEAERARAVAEDRERIGRELHDGIIQSLYAAGLLLQDATLTIDEDKKKAQERVREVIDLLNRTMRDIRRYILDLRGETENPDLQAGLRELVRTFRLDSLIEAEFIAQGTPHGVLTRDQRSHLLTIAREALTNASKHARATRVDVTLHYRPSEIELDIQDNGIGFSHDGGQGKNAGGEHQGLRNMLERAGLIGARLEIDSQPGSGTCVRLIMPLQEGN